MEPHRIGGTEAERWLRMAEKLLATGDLVGCKTFAIRARETDPGLAPAYRIIAVADALIAGEKRINDQRDWYAILQVGDRTQDSELIASQYRRIVLLLNPIRSKLAPADEAFKLVSDAWSVLSNPSAKSLYDNELNLFSNSGSSESDRARENQGKPNQHKQQQQPRIVRRSPRKPSSFSNGETNVTEESGTQSSNSDKDSGFWTACPYCYTMYEYPRIYEDCTLRCQDCRRAFHGVMIPSPPPISDGKEAHFCCWAFFPLAVSMSSLEKNKGEAPNWRPFSPMFTTSQFVDQRNVGEQNVSAAAPKPKSGNARKGSPPRVYVDDQDVFVEVSESSGDDSDDEWGSSTRERKKAKYVKGKGSARKNVGKSQMDKGKNVTAGGGENLQGGSAVQGSAQAPSVMKAAERGKKVVVNNSRKQTGKVGKDLGNLDLNVEFSNEVEEPAPGFSVRNGAGNREEDGIEGTGFFEGLDEFLSSLPILSVVGHDKVKAT